MLLVGDGGQGSGLFENERKRPQGGKKNQPPLNGKNSL